MCIKRIAIFGLGLLGGSICKSVRKFRNDIELLAFGRTPHKLKKALDDGFIDSMGSINEPDLKNVDLIIVSSPVKVSIKIINDILSSSVLGEKAIVIDVGSVKEALIKNIDQKIIFIAEDETRVNEVALRFSRVGYDNTMGYLFGGLKNWIEHGYEVDKIGSITAHEFTEKLKEDTSEIAVDVRRESEFLSIHVIGVKNFPLEFIHENFSEIDPKKEYLIHCETGYMSLIAASIFQANGIMKFTDVRGGFEDITETAAPVSEYVCPTTSL